MSDLAHPAALTQTPFRRVRRLCKRLPYLPDSQWSNTSDTTFDLFNDLLNTNGAMELTATFGTPLVEFLNAEGNYTFHARATYGDTCRGMREVTWSLHVDVGIDAGTTTATSVDLPPGGSGEICIRLTFTPKDKYGNLLGPGRADGFTVQPQPGSTVSSGVIDLGNGSYQVDVCGDGASLLPRLRSASCNQGGRRR